MECNGDFFSGPNIVKRVIYSILKVNNYNKLQGIVKDNIKVVNYKNHKEIRSSTRIGLKPKFEDYSKDESKCGRYIYKLHRFITYVEHKKHNFKEKRNVEQYAKIIG